MKGLQDSEQNQRVFRKKKKIQKKKKIGIEESEGILHNVLVFFALYFVWCLYPQTLHEGET